MYDSSFQPWKEWCPKAVLYVYVMYLNIYIYIHVYSIFQWFPMLIISKNGRANENPHHWLKTSYTPFQVAKGVSLLQKKNVKNVSASDNPNGSSAHNPVVSHSLPTPDAPNLGNRITFPQGGKPYQGPKWGEKTPVIRPFIGGHNSIYNWL